MILILATCRFLGSVSNSEACSDDYGNIVSSKYISFMVSNCLFVISITYRQFQEHKQSM